MEQLTRKPGRKALFSKEEVTATETATEKEEIEKIEEKYDEGIESRLREFLEALEAVRKGDLTKKLKKEGEDIFSELAESYNEMVNILNLFSGEVTRVSREVGTEGKLGAQAEVPGVAGTWKDLTDNVNILASNLTSQVRNIAQVTTAVAKGDLNQKQRYLGYLP